MDVAQRQAHGRPLPGPGLARSLALTAALAVALVAAGARAQATGGSFGGGSFGEPSSAGGAATPSSSYGEHESATERGERDEGPPVSLGDSLRGVAWVAACFGPIAAVWGTLIVLDRRRTRRRRDPPRPGTGAGPAG